MKKARLMAAFAVSVVSVLVVATTGSADTPATLKVAIPVDVQVIVNNTEIAFIGRPTSTSPVVCSPGIPQPQTVRLVNPGGGMAAEISGVLAYHDHEIPLGSRFLVTAGPDACSTDFRLWTVTGI